MLSCSMWAVRGCRLLLHETNLTIALRSFLFGAVFSECTSSSLLTEGRPVLQSRSGMNLKVSPTLFHFSETFLNDGKKKIAVGWLQEISEHVLEPPAYVHFTEPPYKQHGITSNFSSILARCLISISPVITNWQYMLAFSSITVRILYSDFSVKVSLCHQQVKAMLQILSQQKDLPPLQSTLKKKKKFEIHIF